MRIQNEGTGKSSWWVINPDAKPGKAPRRRAGSMETKNLEKKRGRVKKRVEAYRAAQENGTLSKDDFPELQHYSLNLSPEFRTRAGSNASSCGRLSPIQAAVEPDLHDTQVPPMSPIPWGTEIDTDDNYTNSSEGFSLVDSLVGNITLSESGNIQQDLETLGTTIKQELMSGGNLGQYPSNNGYDERYMNLPAPPSYNDHLQKQNTQQPTVLNLDRMVIQNRDYMGMQPKQQQGTNVSVYTDNMYQDNSLHIQDRMMSQRQGMASPSSNTLGINTQQINQSPGRSPQLSPNYSNQRQTYSPQVHSPQLNKRISPQPIQNQQQQLSSQQLAGNRSLLQQCLEAPNDSLLRAALTQTTAAYQMPQNQAYPQYSRGFSSSPVTSFSGTLNNVNNNLQQNMGQMNVGQGPQQQVLMSGQVRNSSNQDIADIDTEIGRAHV